jgi:hypothetical protein
MDRSADFGKIFGISWNDRKKKNYYSHQTITPYSSHAISWDGAPMLLG